MALPDRGATEGTEKNRETRKQGLHKDYTCNPIMELCDNRTMDGMLLRELWLKITIRDTLQVPFDTKSQYGQPLPISDLNESH